VNGKRGYYLAGSQMKYYCQIISFSGSGMIYFQVLKI